ncbi:MAG: FAD-dependent oxidoreductase [Candidatus Methanomethylicaceae archaeon]
MTGKTIKEPAREIPVIRECDVLVVGGGPGGHAAAVSAARCGADTVLLERYGYFGGMATGGLVLLIPHLSDGTEKIIIAGQCLEWIKRLDQLGGVIHPEYSQVGSRDDEVVQFWKDFEKFFVVEDAIQFGAIVDPEMLKCVLNDMAIEAGVDIFLHSWGTKALVEGNRVIGAVFESKSGRQAILAQVTIDATGDGDLLPSAGAEFETYISPDLRISKVAVVFRVANVDMNKLTEYRRKNQEEYSNLMRQVAQQGGFTVFQRTFHEDVVWFNNWYPGINVLNVKDLTKAEVEIRKRMLLTVDFFKKNVPGFEESYILDTAPQIGTRGSRRLKGEYVVTESDWKSGKTYEDTIAVFPQLRRKVSKDSPHVHIPFRALVPKDVENLLVAGRSFSSDDVTNNEFNLIPHCIIYGMAAGTAAALAAKARIAVRNVNISELKHHLIRQGVVLPENL